MGYPTCSILDAHSPDILLEVYTVFSVLLPTGLMLLGNPVPAKSGNDSSPIVTIRARTGSFPYYPFPSFLLKGSASSFEGSPTVGLGDLADAAAEGSIMFIEKGMSRSVNGCGV
jgi:hypothetical protein